MSAAFVVYIVFLIVVSFSVGLAIGYCIWEGNGEYQYNRGYSDAVSRELEFRSFDERWLM